jgi:hypothetical protein
MQAQTNHNHARPNAPTLTPETLVCNLPRWAIQAFRVALFTIGMASAALVFFAGGEMPWPAMAIGVVLAIGLTVGAWLPSLWEHTIHFMADVSGVYFPSISTPPGQQPTWLAVPWQNISNIRLARVSGEVGRRLAFDVQAEPEQVAQFLASADTPGDRRTPLDGTAALAFGGWPLPAASEMCAELQRLKQGTKR